MEYNPFLPREKKIGGEKWCFRLPQSPQLIPDSSYSPLKSGS